MVFKMVEIHIFISDGGVEHQVIQRAGRPVSIEIMFYENDSIAVDGIH
jgi:hypothetical protein